MSAAIGIGIGVLLIIVYVIGQAVGTRGSIPTITPGENTTDLESCWAACQQWSLRRVERCNAERDEASAQARVSSFRASFLAVVAALTAAIIAAAQVAAIPIIGPAAAAALLAVAAALVASAAYLLGVLQAAINDLAIKAAAAQGARTAETRAYELMLQKCPPEEVAKCLAMPAPC